MRKATLLVIFILLSNVLAAQKDYFFGTKHKNSLTSVYYTFTGKDYKTQYRYGLFDENKQKLILPLQYTKIWNSNEDDIFILEDTTKKWSLYSAKSNEFIVKSEYAEIKPFSDGLAIVSKMQDGKLIYGAIDKTGKLIIPIQYKFLGNLSENLICFSREKGYGFIDKNNKEVIPPLYRSASVFKSGLACVSFLDSTYYGYIDKNNKWIISPKYIRGGDFNGNYAVVNATRNYTLNSDNAGVINKAGKEIIPMKYDNITIEDNFLIVKEIRKDSYLTVTRYGVLNFDGKELLPIEYASINKKYGIDFYEITKNSKSSLIDKNGKFSMLGEYDYIYTFTDFGISHVRRDKKYTVIDKNLKTIIPELGANNIILGRKNKIALLFNNKVEIYNEMGKLLKTIKQENVIAYGTEFYSNDDSLKMKFSNIVYLYDIPSNKMQLLDFSEVADFNEEGIFVGKNISYDFLDHTGKKLNTKPYTSVVNFSEGICAVQESSYSTPYLADKSFTKIKDLTNIFEGPFSEGMAKAKSQYGNNRYYYDKKGNYISITDAADAGNFKNGRAYIKKQYTNKFYFINKSGNKINNEEYDEIGEFSENLAGVKKSGKTGYIDTTGKMVIPYKFDIGTPFYNGFALVKDVNEYYLINKKGEKAMKDIYNGATNPANGTYPVQKGTSYGIIDEKGKVLIDFKYQEILPLYENIAWAKKDGKWGLVNSSNKVLTDFEYETGDKCKNGYIKVGIGNKLGLLDKNGKIVLPIIYDQIGTVYNNKVLLVRNAGININAVK